MKEEKINPFEMAKKQIAPKFQRGSGYFSFEKNPYVNSYPYAWDWAGCGDDQTERHLSIK